MVLSHCGDGKSSLNLKNISISLLCTQQCGEGGIWQQGNFHKMLLSY